MAPKYDSVRCKACARVLAVVSATGLTPTTSPDTSHAGCSTCQEFETLYDAVRAADTEWAVLENKRDSITKSFARETHKKAHMEFDNWLMTVEAPGSPRDVQDGQHEDKNLEDGHIANENGEEMLGTKGRRSHPPTMQRPGDISDLGPQEQQSISLSLRPSPKRSHSAASATGRKRLKFSDSVQFHENYRTSEQYHRPSETYVRGKNAPPEGSEYMDTSGSGLTFLKFTGTKKVGAKWVELSEEELAKQSEKAKTLTQLRKLATTGQLNAEPADDDPVDEASQNEGAPLDARAARLARRAKGASSAESSQTGGLISRQNRETGRSEKELQSDGAPDSVKETVVSSALALSATTARGDHHHSDRSLGRVENIGDDGLERRSDAVPETATRAAMCADQARDAAKPHDEPHMETQATSEAKCQGNAAQSSTSTVELQPMALSGSGSSQTEPMENTSCKTHDAPEAGIQEASSNSLDLRPMLTDDEESKTLSAESSIRYSTPRREACENSVQMGDAVHDDTGLAAQTTPGLLEKTSAIDTLRESFGEQEHSVKNPSTLLSADSETQMQVDSNAAIASVTIPQDPDRHPAARTYTEETQIRAGGLIDEAEDVSSQNLA